MPFCPKCRDEFQDWVKICPDDGIPLVAKLPPEPEKIIVKDSIVPVATAPNEMVAKMWEGILKDNGISSLLSTDSSALASSSTFVNMPIIIYVLDSKEKQAKKILAPLMGK